VAVNHHRTQILAQHQEADPWAGLGPPAPSKPPLVKDDGPPL
jgi:hypothetical protein